jgi:hypothetical protein
MRGDVIKSKKTGETRTVTAVEGSKLLLDNGKQITPFNDWVILKKSSAK